VFIEWCLVNRRDFTFTLQ